MLLFKKTADLQNHLAAERRTGKIIGFAPTMGALHDGHLDLIRRAKTEKCDLVVASIFVNPTQFNDPKDLEKYPRTPEKDIRLLLSAGCDVLFMPDEVGEIYPPGLDLTVKFDFGPLAEVMEGRFRPGHFQGMATVVKRLLDIVGPDQLFMGQKDYQQLSICRNLILQAALPVKLVMVDTRREPDGLAMSSRNVRLSPEMRAAAPVIFQVLKKTSDELADKPVEFLEKQALETLAAAGLKPEYFEIVDGISLQPIGGEAGDSDFVVACVAVWAGEVRLIDNLVLKG